ncbi:hypothetical protein [Marinobacter xestospongiae]|uniref:Uncharacterized protein n=1 Tax=Marinobacter xestospongiae TaxID=994319 RepID=A0ABU3W024_9GAMM|nr:hypothetical protein [Marinobacter xestospongiae]MDV2079854.1 hypothetical protein [Marinobacter xestospongiae]
MSVISITVLGGSKSAAVVKAVRSLSKASIAEVTWALETEAPVFEHEIFDNEIEGTFALVRKFLDKSEELSLSLVIEEDGAAISPRILRDIMLSFDEIRIGVRELGEFRHS